jgi:hypothetical protein
MVTTLDVRTFIKTDAYQRLFNDVVKQLNIKLIEEDDMPVGFVNVYAEYINQASRIANASFHDLEVLCDDEKIISFIRIHIDEVRDDDYDKDGELIETLGYDNGFIIWFLLKYFFLKNHPDKLTNYFDLLKIRGYRKLAKQLKDIYKRI